MGKLIVMGKSSLLMDGEPAEKTLQLFWSKHDMKQVAIAEKAFEEYTVKGWIAISEISGRRRQIFRFDPNLDEILLAPIVVGG